MMLLITNWVEKEHVVLQNMSEEAITEVLENLVKHLSYQPGGDPCMKRVDGKLIGVKTDEMSWSMIPDGGGR